MNPLELAGSLLGLVNIVLLVRRSVWNFPVAMAMVALVGVVLAGARLYSEAGLQAFFFVVNAYGWRLWSKARGAADDVPVAWMAWPARVAWLAGTATLSLTLGWVMHRFTNAALPFADSAITGASIAAQFLLSFRRIENWVLWIAIDVASVALYLNRGLVLFAVLYVAFGVLSVVGLRAWIAAAHGAQA
ncbi:nicotinamide riboside transporter PnuC [Novosphingobium lentum]|uniref:nicotinamide riboside transporter PnuC n=1 Tax=Novosphingobium lentum TaxID=145287 RepID=UPI0008333495|nr:nicotinamide riboside transporter PnuC [Novosphingobium lentum]